MMFSWLFNKSNDQRNRIKITHDVVALPSGIRVLRLHCSGHYPPGSNGHPQAEQIYEVGAKAFLATHADAVLLDFTDLDYVWGDDLLMAFDIPTHPSIGRDDCPTVALSGPKCGAALKTLMEDTCATWQDTDHLFLDEASALEQIDRVTHKGA